MGFIHGSDSSSHVNESYQIQAGVPSNHEVRTSPSKGLGVFASQPIQAGTQIMQEIPLISVKMPEMVPGQGFRVTDMIDDIDAAFRKLNTTEQASFLSLHDFRYPGEEDQSHLLSILRSNGYITGDRIGLFPRASRINHSCRPNAGTWWSEKSGRRLVYAHRDIAEGEEITVSYIPLLQSARDRQARLQQYGFECDCDACNERSDTSDKRRVRIGMLLEDLEGKLVRKSQKSNVNKQRMKKTVDLVRMVEQEDVRDYIARAYHVAAVISEHNDEYDEARRWGEMEGRVLGWVEAGSDERLASQNFINSLRKS